MLRYLALAWDSDNSEQTSAAQNILRKMHVHDHEWRAATEQTGLHVIYSGGIVNSGDIQPLSNSGGIVVGPLFERRNDLTDASLPRRAILKSDDCRLIASTHGRHLVEAYWGSYVAIIQNPAEHRRWVVMAPMGSLHCFAMRLNGVWLFASDLEDVVALGVIQFSVNWSVVTCMVLLDLWPGCDTGLNEVTMVGPGECLRIDRERTSRSLYWDPFEISSTNVLDDFEYTSRAARATVTACVHAWASRHEHIVHALSGGLDSSIILSCLQDAPTHPRIVCVNEYSEGYAEDERIFARISSAAAGCELVEHYRDMDFLFNEMLNERPTAVPYMYLTDIGTYKRLAQLVRNIPASARFTGILGDALFYLHPAVPAAADYARLHGLTPGLLRVAFDVGRLGRTSIWRVLRDALATGALRHQIPSEFYWTIHSSLAAESNTLGNPEVAAAFRPGEGLLHPWFRSRHTAPPGKLWQIFEVSKYLVENPIRLPKGMDEVGPYLSQPLAELCLRTPTYLHLNAGWDRAIARRAFDGRVPKEILLRVTKGTREEHVKHTITRNTAFVRELLLNGALIREGLLDRRKVEAAVSGEPNSTRAYPMEILTYVSIEIWLQQWETVKLRAAA